MRPRPSVSAIAALLIASSLGGCTAVNSQIHLARAESAVKRAAERGAAEGAVYEYTLAVRYLEKAREEVHHNRFGPSDELAKAATSYADQAVIALEQAGRQEALDQAGALDTLPDTIGAELEDEVEVIEDYVDLPDSEISPDDLITDEEVEALFGQQALEAMQEEGELQGPGDDTSPREPSSDSDADTGDEGWQDLAPEDDDL